MRFDESWGYVVVERNFVEKPGAAELVDKGPLPHVEQDLDVGIVELFAHMVPGLHLLFLVVEGMVDGLRQDDKCLVAALLLLVELPAGVLELKKKFISQFDK